MHLTDGNQTWPGFILKSDRIAPILNFLQSNNIKASATLHNDNSDRYPFESYVELTISGECGGGDLYLHVNDAVIFDVESKPIHLKEKVVDVLHLRPYNSPVPNEVNTSKDTLNKEKLNNSIVANNKFLKTVNDLRETNKALEKELYRRNEGLAEHQETAILNEELQKRMKILLDEGEKMQDQLEAMELSKNGVALKNKELEKRVRVLEAELSKYNDG